MVYMRNNAEVSYVFHQLKLLSLSDSFRYMYLYFLMVFATIHKNREYFFSSYICFSIPFFLSIFNHENLKMSCYTLLNPYNIRSEEHTSELQSRENLVCRLLLEKKKNNKI